MPKEAINTTANHDSALRYPFEDTAASMANEVNRSSRSKWVADECGICHGWHIVNNASGLYLTR